MKLLIQISVVIVLVTQAASAQAADSERPNILFILLDDFGWKDTSYAGSDFYETPHIDALAKGGTVFTNAYSAAANCAPARACLLSGQYTPKHEVFNVGTGPRGPERERKVVFIPGSSSLPETTKTWGNALQDAGYKTGTFGKWHATKDPIPWGFEVNVGGTHGGSPPKGYYPPHPNVPGLSDVREGEWLTDTLGNRVIDFIRDNKDDSWCAYFTAFNVHTPIQSKKDLVEKWKAKTPGKIHDSVPMATMIQSVDDVVGRIVATLEELDLRDDTVIFFFSDNGGYGPITDMDPLFGYKGTYYEGGIRVPFFANWPGKIPANKTNDTPIIGVDVFPTLCELAGAELPDQELDGVSLAGLLTGRTEALEQRPIFWHFPAYLQSYSGKFNREQSDPFFRSRPVGVVRIGDYKLMEHFEDGRLELYNLADDIGEKNNLAESMPEKVQELLTIMKKWRESTNAPVPTEPNPKYAPGAAKRDDAKKRKKKPRKSEEKEAAQAWEDAKASSAFVFGQVAQPGIVKLRDEKSGQDIVEVINEAGGVLKKAYQQQIRVTRGKGTPEEKTFAINFGQLTQTKEAQDAKTLFVQAGDYVYVPERIGF